jgi:aspartyl/asparaginyl-tRNA synthetase
MEIKRDYEEVLFLIRDLMHYILKGLESGFKPQTERVRAAYKSEPFVIPEKSEDVPIISFKEGIKLLQEAGNSAVSPLEDINSTDEKELGRLVKEKYGGTDFYILKEYPTAARAFYTMPKPDDPEYSLSFDLMLRGQEVLSGAQRIHDHEMLCKRMRELQLDPEGPGFKDYVQAFAYGTCVPYEPADSYRFRSVELD